MNGGVSSREMGDGSRNSITGQFHKKKNSIGEEMPPRAGGGST